MVTTLRIAWSQTISHACHVHQAMKPSAAAPRAVPGYVALEQLLAARSRIIPRPSNSHPTTGQATGAVASSDSAAAGQKPVLYWMSRDQRLRDNHALWYAATRAAALNGLPPVAPGPLPVTVAGDTAPGTHSPAAGPGQGTAQDSQAAGAGPSSSSKAGSGNASASTNPGSSSSSVTQPLVAVAFNLVPGFLNAGARHFGFVLRGLRELAAAAAQQGIPFFLLQGQPQDTIPALAAQLGAGLVVVDYSPMRIGRTWRQEVAGALPPGVELHEVDTHNVVPVWAASSKRETAARTLRPKVQAQLPRFLVELPGGGAPPALAPWPPGLPQPPATDWDTLIAEVVSRGADVPEVTWCKPGEAAAHAALQGFLGRIAKYKEGRNNPNAQAVSDLSPYLHYGQLSPARAVLEARKRGSRSKEAADAFVEEVVVRRELADNFAEYTPDDYDKLTGAPEWAQATLAKHAGDPRPVLYSRHQLEFGLTGDPIWNAAQLEMVHRGKMHGYMRMYWAKKILEWTPSPAEALEVAISLNDKYEMDGRDPNGYVGCMWGIAGLHDQGFAERPVFGKIRYMNAAGCKRKFDTDAYIAYVDQLVAQYAAAATGTPSEARGAGAVPQGAAGGAGAGSSGRRGAQRKLQFPASPAAAEKGATVEAAPGQQLAAPTTVAAASEEGMTGTVAPDNGAAAAERKEVLAAPATADVVAAGQPATVAGEVGAGTGGAAVPEAEGVTKEQAGYDGKSSTVPPGSKKRGGRGGEAGAAGQSSSSKRSKKETAQQQLPVEAWMAGAQGTAADVDE